MAIQKANTLNTPELHVNYLQSKLACLYNNVIYSDTILSCSTDSIKILCGRPNFGVIDAFH